MRFVRIAACAAVLAAGCLADRAPGLAAGTPAPGHAKARCAPGDPSVYLNPKTKRYAPVTPATTASVATSGAGGTLRILCASQAKKLGARPLTVAETKRMGHP